MRTLAPELALHLTPAQLAERWTTTPARLANDRSAGRGPAYLKIGANVRYRLIDVEAFEVASLRGAA